MLSRRRLLVGATVTAAAVAGPPVAVHALAAREPWHFPVSDEIVAWLKANSVPLATTEPGSRPDDLEFLRPAVKNARIVSLGEATHATHEFSQLRHRVIEYCVTELGFTMIAVEDNYGQVFQVNDYVLHGKGSAAEAVAAMGLWMWKTEEFVALVERMRAWNVANARKVKFYGIDMQGCILEGRYLCEYLRRVGSDLAAESEASFATLPPDSWTPVAAPENDRLVAHIGRILGAFDSERALWVSRSSELDWSLARRSAVVVDQCVRCPQDVLSYMEWRDRCMAENVSALLAAEGPQAKALVLSHNMHAGRTPWIGSVMSMGGVLHDEFGAQQVVIGFSFNQGRFRIPARQTVGPAPPGFLDAALTRTGYPLLALDLRRVPSSGPVAAWMASKPLHRNAGGGSRIEPRWYQIRYWYELFNPPFSMPGNPKKDFDILMFVETSTASRPLSA